MERKAGPSYDWNAPLLALLGVLLCVGGARSTLGHRPVNPSTVVFSSDSHINTLPLSSAYSVVYALYENIKHEQDGKPIYGEMHTETAFR